MTGERRFAWALLCVVLVVNAIALSAELRVGRITGNDNVSHLALVKGMARAVENGANPLDFWSPEASFGSAPIRTYQPLAHALVVLVYFALGKTVSSVRASPIIRSCVRDFTRSRAASPSVAGSSIRHESPMRSPEIFGRRLLHLWDFRCERGSCRSPRQ